MSDCKCDLRMRLVGDGCQRCNPQMAIELLKERLEELRAAADQADEEYLAEIASMRLTDEEREAIAWIVQECYAGNIHAPLGYVATLRGLLKRLGGER